MANKDQRRSNRETRKPKKEKAKPAAASTGTSFAARLGAQDVDRNGRKN